MPKYKGNLNAVYISERLQECLRPIAGCALTTIIAPMGYGKTTAINWYLPGILMGLCVAGLAIFIAVKKGYKSSDVKEPDPAIKVIIDAVPSLPADHPLWAEELGVTALRGMAAFPRKPNGGPIPADCCKTEG